MPLVAILVAAAAVWLYFKSQAVAGAPPPAAPAPPPAPGTGNPFTAPGTGNPFSALAVAWAHAEGYDQPGSLARRNNNPVNLKGNWPGQIGSTSQGFAIFPDSTWGFNAAQSYLQGQAAAHPDWTLRNLFGKILGNLSGQPVNNDQGNSDQEAATVANSMGISPDVSLVNLAGGSYYGN